MTYSRKKLNMRKSLSLVSGIIILGILIWIVSIGIIYAVQSYRSDPNTTITIDEHGVCMKVVNLGTYSYFIPTNASIEWSLFRSVANFLPGISLAPCSAINNKDTIFWEWRPNNNYGTIGHLTLRLDDWGSSRNNFAMEWTLPDNPGAEITSIKLHLWLFGCSPVGTGGYSIGELHELQESIQSETTSTWNSRGINNWTNSGAWEPVSANSTIVDRIDFRVGANRVPGWKTWVLKGTGAENPVLWNWGETHAFVVYDSRNIVDGRSCRFYSKEAADPSKHPYLEIEYN